MLMSERAEGSAGQPPEQPPEKPEKPEKKRLFHRMIESEGPIAQQLILRTEQALVHVASRVEASNLRSSRG